MHGMKLTRLKRTGKAFVAALSMMVHQESPGTAAAISYFSLFALFPAIVVVVTLLDRFWGWIFAHQTMMQTILALFPGSRKFVVENLAEITQPGASVFVSCLIIVFWSSSWVLMLIEKALNRAWGVQKRRTFWQSRFRSLMLLASCGVLFLISAGITGGVSALRSRANLTVPEFAEDEIINLLWSSILLAVGFMLAIVVFFVVYKVMPDHKVTWLEALSAAIFAAFFWEVASYIFAALVPSFNYQRVYGKMGAIIALLAWGYTSTLILQFGAHFSARLHRPDLEARPLFPSKKRRTDLPADDLSDRRIEALPRRQ